MVQVEYAKHLMLDIDEATDALTWNDLEYAREVLLWHHGSSLDQAGQRVGGHHPEAAK